MTGIAAILHHEIPNLDDLLEGQEDDGDIDSGDDDSEFIVGLETEEEKSEDKSDKESDYGKRA